MKEAKLFMNGQSQAVRLPREFRFTGETVFVNRVGQYVVLIPKDDPWSGMREACSKFSDDFMDTRSQGDAENREEFD